MSLSELENSLAEMRKLLKVKQRKLKKYNRILRNKEHICQTLKRETEEPLDVANFDKNANKKSVSFKEGAPDVISFSEIDSQSASDINSIERLHTSTVSQSNISAKCLNKNKDSDSIVNSSISEKLASSVVDSCPEVGSNIKENNVTLRRIPSEDLFVTQNSSSINDSSCNDCFGLCSQSKSTNKDFSNDILPNNKTICSKEDSNSQHLNSHKQSYLDCRINKSSPICEDEKVECPEPNCVGLTDCEDRLLCDEDSFLKRDEGLKCINVQTTSTCPKGLCATDNTGKRRPMDMMKMQENDSMSEDDWDNDSFLENLSESFSNKIPFEAKANVSSNLPLQLDVRDVSFQQNEADLGNVICCSQAIFEEQSFILILYSSGAGRLIRLNETCMGKEDFEVVKEFLCNTLVSNVDHQVCSLPSDENLRFLVYSYSTDESNVVLIQYSNEDVIVVDTNISHHACRDCIPQMCGVDSWLAVIYFHHPESETSSLSGTVLQSALPSGNRVTETFSKLTESDHSSKTRNHSIENRVEGGDKTLVPTCQYSNKLIKMLHLDLLYSKRKRSHTLDISEEEIFTDLSIAKILQPIISRDDFVCESTHFFIHSLLENSIDLYKVEDHLIQAVHSTTGFKVKLEESQNIIWAAAVDKGLFWLSENCNHYIMHAVSLLGDRKKSQRWMKPRSSIDCPGIKSVAFSDTRFLVISNGGDLQCLDLV